MIKTQIRVIRVTLRMRSGPCSCCPRQGELVGIVCPWPQPTRTETQQFISLLHSVAYCCDLLHWQPALTAIDELLAQSSEWAGMKLMVFDDVRVRSNGLITAAKLLKKHEQYEQQQAGDRKLTFSQLWEEHRETLERPGEYGSLAEIGYYGPMDPHGLW